MNNSENMQTRPLPVFDAGSIRGRNDQLDFHQCRRHDNERDDRNGVLLCDHSCWRVADARIRLHDPLQ